MPGETAGLLHLYIGDGKGKTTASIGLCIRALGAGKRVLFAQFLKGRDTAELEPLRRLGIEVRRTEPVKKFLSAMDEREREECRRSCCELFAFTADALHEGRYGLVVLDEVLDAVNAGIFTEEELCRALMERERTVEAVCTGRNPGEEIRAAADYISEIRALRHPYTRGIAARPGIEY